MRTDWTLLVALIRGQSDLGSYSNAYGNNPMLSMPSKRIRSLLAYFLHGRAVPLLLITNTLLLATTVFLQIKGANDSPRCGKAPQGWDVLVTRPHDSACADVLVSHTIEGTHILRVFNQGELKVANADAIPCRICNAMDHSDPLVDLKWERDSLIALNVYGNDQTITEGWTFSVRGEQWVLSNWERTLMESWHGPYWKERSDLETKRVSVEVHLNTEESLCENESEKVVGCSGMQLSPPIQESCTASDLSPDIDRIAKLRLRDFDCNVAARIEAAMIEHSTERKTYQVVPLEEPDPLGIPEASSFDAREI